ncbi:hypothetical protein C8R45DRAFT_931658 [Mycena sanguinolenta]|nr:hypothetical protein C8R45DRAFT_931658 [Mycena sanguinolenta]
MDAAEITARRSNGAEVNREQEPLQVRSGEAITGWMRGGANAPEICNRCTTLATTMAFCMTDERQGIMAAASLVAGSVSAAEARRESYLEKIEEVDAGECDKSAAGQQDASVKDEPRRVSRNADTGHGAEPGVALRKTSGTAFTGEMAGRKRPNAQRSEHGSFRDGEDGSGAREGEAAKRAPCLPCLPLRPARSRVSGSPCLSSQLGSNWHRGQ